MTVKTSGSSLLRYGLGQLPAGLRPVGSTWNVVSWLIALAVLAPVLSLLWLALGTDRSHWQHLLQYVLPDAVSNTVLLLAGVGFLVSVIGTGCAWLVTACDFPGRKLLLWALLLPLAMPTYIVAFAYLDLLHPIGPVQGALRWLLGYDSPRQWRLPEIRSLGGAIFVLGFVLYPYVYLTARAMFVTQPAHLLEAARTLGESHWGAFWRVALPLARPALAVGLSLALLETLNDIGASEFLGIHTLTVSVYTTWVTRSDLAGAAQIACTMLLMVIVLIWLEQHNRHRQRFDSVQRMRAIQPHRLHGVTAWLVTSITALPVLIGFVAPAAYLFWESGKRLSIGVGISSSLWHSLGNTLVLAVCVTLLATLCGLVVAWSTRRSVSSIASSQWSARTASLGYAVPGTVLAIGLLTPALMLDTALADLFQQSSLPLMASGLVLTVACTMRFLAISVGSLQAGLARIPSTLEQASRLLGQTRLGTLWHVHLPLLRPAMASSALLVFVDAMKELPATLLLRPADFDTLATWLYAEAARGTYEEGAIAALFIVLAGLLPVILLARAQSTPAIVSAPSSYTPAPLSPQPRAKAVP